METTTQIEKQEYEFQFFRKHTIWYSCPFTVEAESLDEAKRIVMEAMRKIEKEGYYDELGRLQAEQAIYVDYSCGDWQYDTVENCDEEGCLEIQSNSDEDQYSDPIYSSPKQ